MHIEKLLVEAVDGRLPELWEIANYLHKNPEVSGQEYKAQNRLTCYLEKNGFECEKGVAHLDTAFVAWSGPKKHPAVGFIAEYDALSGLGHGCGHNLIAAAAVGAAVAMIDVLPNLSGQVAVIGTPAEEDMTFQAKQTMLDHGSFEGVDVVLGNHGADRTATGTKSLALKPVEFSFKGKASHPSTFPHHGVSALDAAILTMTALEFLREHLRQDARIHGIITEGGSRPNIVPEHAKLLYHLRALDENYLEEVQNRAFDCARAGALATGADVSINVLGGYANKVLVETLDRMLLEDAILCGATQVMEPPEEKGSTDSGNVSHRFPFASLKVAFVPVGTAGHTLEYVKAACSPAGKKAVAIASKAMSMTATRLLRDKSLLEKVKAEHRRKLHQAL